MRNLTHVFFDESISDKASLATSSALFDKYFDLKRKALSFDNIPDDIIFFNHNNELNQTELKCNMFISQI